MACATNAIALAVSSDWTALRCLVEGDHVAAREKDDFGMLAVHWASTEHDVPIDLLHALLKANPDGASTKNNANMLPIHIAIRAKAPMVWLETLLEAFPRGALEKTPTGKLPWELAEQVGLPFESVDFLRRMEQKAKGGGAETEASANAEWERVSKDTTRLRNGSSTDFYSSPQKSLRSAHLSSLKSNSTSNIHRGLRSQPMKLTRSNTTADVNARQNMPFRRSSTTPIEPTESFQAPRVLENSFHGSVGAQIESTRKCSSNALNSFDNKNYPPAESRESELSHKPGAQHDGRSFRRDMLDTATSANPLLSHEGETQASMLRKDSPESHKKLPPRWRLDTSCNMCSKPFGLFKPRHHCRNCGRSICRDHCAGRLALPSMGIQAPQKVCVLCYPTVKREGQQVAINDPPFQQFEDNPAEMEQLDQLDQHGELDNYDGNNTVRLSTHMQISELTAAVASLRVQVDDLRRAKAEAHNQLLEQEEVQAKTMLLLTQTMTRLSELELKLTCAPGVA